jgi:subtilisin family serine protease
MALVLLLTFSQSFPSYTRVIVSFVPGEYDPEAIRTAGGTVTAQFKELGMAQAILPQNSLASLRHEPGVEFVEEDGNLEIAQVDAPTSIEYSSSWGLQDIEAEPVHLSNYTGKGVKIGVLDTGIDYKHPDLAANYKGGHDFINNDDDPMDDNGHGTHVAGILAAARNGKGAVGVAPDADLYAVKVSDSNGKGSFSGLVEGINWAIENHMDIVTMSITGEGGSMALEKAVKMAYDDGLILVAAVGNGEGEGVLYPAAYDDVIGVGSVDEDNTLSSFSLTGSEVDIVAPGSAIKSTWLGGEYQFSSGTSMATPFVTGAIALLLGSNEQDWIYTGAVNGDSKWTNSEVRKVLETTAKDLGTKGKDNSYGYGLLDLHFPNKNGPASVQVALDNPTPENTTEKVLTGTVWLGLKLSFYLFND